MRKTQCCEKGLSAARPDVAAYERRLQRIPNEEVAWLAGLFIGEGHFGISRHGRTARFVVAITNTDREVLDLVARRFGGKVRRHERANLRRGERQTWRWYAPENFTTVALVNRLRAYLKGKKQRQAALVLQFAEVKQRLWQRRDADRRRQYTLAESLEILEAAFRARMYAGGGSKNWRGTWRSAIRVLKQRVREERRGLSR